MHLIEELLVAANFRVIFEIYIQAGHGEPHALQFGEQPQQRV